MILKGGVPVKKLTKILLSVLVVLVVILGGIIGIVLNSDETASNTELDYTIFDEQLDDSNQQHLRIETDSTDEKSLVDIVNQIHQDGEYEDADSVYIHFTQQGPENTDDDDVLEPSTLRARFANTEKGLAQTGLEELGTVHTTYLYDE